MNWSEDPVLFDLAGDQLIGIVSRPNAPQTDVGVLVLVGGPQYRVGSHRQFALLARKLAGDGIPCMRFDVRGMGDSTGDMRSFEHLNDDVRAALDAFSAHMPEVRRFVLWGLCDGASAACFYVNHDPRVVGAILLNPWVRTEAGQARTYLRHYYLQRVLDPAFWRKLFGGGVSVFQSLKGFFGAARQVAGDRDKHQPRSDLNLPERMALDLVACAKPACIILSGRDFVAREFESVVENSETWRAVAAALKPVRFPEADHTFSTAKWRDAVAKHTADWVLGLDVIPEEGKS